MSFVKFIRDRIKEHAEAVSEFSDIPAVSNAADLFLSCLKGGGKVMACGNGGSAADAQHFVAELVGRFYNDRRAFSGLALTTDTSILTCLANDYSFDEVFSRQVEALGRKGDVLLCISTSGKSRNVIRAAEQAERMGIKTIGLIGEGGALSSICDVSISVPSSRTPRVQEIHSLVLHIIAELIEKELE